jgi:hypothetical protein
MRDSIRAGKPYDAMVRELVSGNGDSYLSGPPNYAVRQIQRNGPPQDTFDNLAAIRLYEALGYGSFARRRFYYEDRTDALRYQKPLPRLG